MGTVRFDVVDDPDAVAGGACSLVRRTVERAITERGQCYLALAGGSSPRALYRLLASTPDLVDWTRVHLFVSDDRVVPLSDERSNSGMVNRELLAGGVVSPAQWHPVVADVEGGPDQVAARYEDIVRNVVPAAAGVPVFDLVLLGVGSDGHTASLFPGKPALEEKERLVVASTPGELPPPVDRVTFTFPLINAARTVLFLSSGADKASTITRVRSQLSEPPAHGHLPAAMVRARHGDVIWLVDEASGGAATAQPPASSAQE